MIPGPARDPANGGDGNDASDASDADGTGRGRDPGDQPQNQDAAGRRRDRDRDPAGRPRDRDAAGRVRDRDAAGRPRNARPRDGLGRPLPRSASAGTERIPDDLEAGPAEAASLGGSLLAEGRPFHAHEVFEAAWKTGPPAERELWQGLAQVAVGITHARRGNPRGAVTLLLRGADRIRAYATAARSGPHARNQRAYGIDPGFVIARAEDMAATVSSRGLPALAEADLRFPLSPPAP